MSVPSRAFLIQQSILNAALTYEDEISQRIIKSCGIPAMLGCMAPTNFVRPSFCDQVRKEYSLLASRYQERNAA